MVTIKQPTNRLFLEQVRLDQQKIDLYQTIAKVNQEIRYQLFVMGARFTWKKVKTRSGKYDNNQLFWLFGIWNIKQVK